ncbi:uncharacterized protein FIBRA_00394 [Fibroporia radiculosa]|uniref:Uncharacterized protein n=1 Tax=Fibroporia radiculosa TaxID=599839 RepID=J4GZX5_9APHY|nr:uncharacterized protein FIBRA_00394 [Fibroporia radiculosa]CCL98399.1 predicted protein [Fibroporia radiculosa]
MARATRSSADKGKQQDAAPTIRKAGSKKRKRNSTAEHDEQPAAKQARTDDSQEPEEQQPTDTKVPDLLGSGDVPIDPSDAQKVLDVLEMVDTQGLLDRVFPLPTKHPESLSPDVSGSSSSAQTYSLRTLLQHSSEHTLKVLRASSAVQHLYPISSHPRARTSSPAAQQLRFCNLALSLLDQASLRSIPATLNVQSLFPALIDVPGDADEKKADDSVSPVLNSPRRRKYALVQRLPTGDWWTSLNSDVAQSDGKELSGLSTAHAELAVIFPSSSNSAAGDKTLAAFVTRRLGAALPQVPGPRRVSCGKFLDYGTYASFAPSFDQDGVEVGRDYLGEVIWQQRHKARIRDKSKGKQRALPDVTPSSEDLVLSSTPASGEKATTGHVQEADDDWDYENALETVLPPDEAAAIKSAMGSLELEQAVQELLDRNARALLRLQRLQRERLGSDGGGLSVVEESSEEWKIAQAIIDSLAVLASLRPRCSSRDDSEAPFVPSPSALRTLQRTLPVDASLGWYGTLPENRATALRDDTTVSVTPTTAVASAPSVTTTVAPTATPVKPNASNTPYTPFNFSNYPASQYRGGYGTYAPGQPSSYYANYSTGAQGQTATGTHYPNAQYGSAGQYSYSSWYNYQQTSTAAQVPAGTPGGSTSARTTPQPVTTPTSMPTNYASFFASTTQQPSQSQQRAVANTVLTAAAKAYQPAAWASVGQTGTTPTLPLHLRATTTASSTPGTPQPATPGGTTPYAAQNFYGNYQPSPAPAAR